MRPSEHPIWPSVPGWCSSEEADALYEQAKETIGDGAVVEIGTAMGRSAIAMSLCGVDVITIDYDRERVDSALQNAGLCGTWIKTLAGDSREIAFGWQEPIALLFIDGWHDYHNISSDYAAWAPHVIPGGAIWFHDAYGAGWPDVQTLIDELVASGTLTLEGYTGTIARCRKVGA